ncbi:PorP/SprF family type IX secretion system membrane protein [Flavobacteriaceae bacterium]|nr:PorP/SprF family type IX secretion system membrane protein [Flavobacteriaceae bacterium]
MKKQFFIYLSLFCISFGYAQSGLKLSDYYQNPIIYNPAYVGASSAIFVKGFYSTQWLGFDKAPTTQILDVQSLSRNERYGLGLSVLNDNFGAVQNFNLEANYALHLLLTDELKLALGLKVGLNKFSIDYSMLDIYDGTDDVYNNGNLSENKPVIGSGFYLSQKDWFFGVSIPNMLQHRLKDEFQRFVYGKIPHYYITGGYQFYPAQDWIVKSHVLTQMVKGAPLDILFSLQAHYKRTFMFGVNAQPNGIFGAMVSARLNDDITFLYGYDIANTALGPYSYGNHSLGISWSLFLGQKDWADRLENDKSYLIR